MFRPLLALIVLLFWSQGANAVSVSLTSPVNNATYTAPATVTISSEAETWEDGERINSHKLYRNGVQIASGTTRSHSTTLSGLAAGSYQFYSVAVNSWGESVQSTPHNITVVVPGGNPPTVTMAAPASGPYIAPASVALSAAAADSDGYITKVEFLANGGLIGTDASAPFAVTWSNAPAGNHSITAKAFDNNGIATTSAAVGVTIGSTTVTGNIEGTGLVGAEYSLSGWACTTGRNQSIGVHLYAGGGWPEGVYVGAYTANQASEPAVAAVCQAQGTTYRFAIPITAAIRQQHANKKIYIHGISPEGGANLLIAGSGAFTIPPPLSLSRKYVYDGHQQLCKVIEPETGATVMAYDASGNLNWSASGLSLPDTTNCNRNEAYGSGRRVQRYHNSRNRLTTLNFPDGNGDQNWTYAPDGLPSQIVTFNDGGTTSVINAYSYNKRRLLTGESVQQPNWYVWGIGYGYDANGNLATQSYPTGLSVDYAPNALGQPTRAGSFAHSVSYYPNGAIQQFTYGNGIVHTMQQNARQLPSRVTDGGAADFTYAFDANANPVTIRDVNAVSAAYSGNRDLQYDGLDRLTYAHLHWWQINNFSYDALDNIRRKDHFNGSTTAVQNYVYDAVNRLSLIRNEAGAATTALEFDVQGNLRVKNGQTYSFDFGNRLREVVGKDTYRYDGYGRRVRSWNASGGYNLLTQYSQAGQMLYRANGRINTNSEHIYLSGSLVATRESGPGGVATRYQHTDALGSPVAMTNEAGQVVERTNYEPYGAAINKAVDGVGYTGHVMDAATGLTYMQQRYYDPSIGRFLSVDPVTADGNTGANFNRYKYASNNPYKFVDPDGRADLCKCDPALVEQQRHARIEAREALDPVTPEAALFPQLRLPMLGSRIVTSAERTARAGHNGVEGPAKVVARTTRSGEPAAKITYPNGSVKDVSLSRVKESVPQTHPNAPPGTTQRVKFERAQPGTKGYKRDPTPADLKEAGIKK